MRLIDAEKVGCGMAETWQRVIVGLEVDKTPTIDPETLPIVRQLRAELARVTAERDAAVECIYNIEDDLDRGNDNDWAREHISEWSGQQEDR